MGWTVVRRHLANDEAEGIEIFKCRKFIGGVGSGALNIGDGGLSAM